MDILGYLTLLIIFVVPIAIGFCTVWFFKAPLRNWVVAIELIIPASLIAFYLSPLPRQLGLTRDPGYDSEVIRMAVIFKLAIGFLITSSVGKVFAALIRYARRHEVKS